MESMVAMRGPGASIARGWPLIGIAILLLTSSATFRPCQASQHRTSLFQKDVSLENAGPEDLLLDELVRNWKWISQQQRHQDVRDDDDLEPVFIEEEEEDQIPIHKQQQKPVGVSHVAMPEQQQRHHPFAYRPHEAGYGATRQHQSQHENLVPQRPSAPVVASVTSSRNDVRMTGQKENILDEIPNADNKDEAGKFPNVVSKSSAHSSDEDDDDSVLDSRGPVAHAIVSTSKQGTPHHDSLADIYLTALVAGCTASAVAAILALGVCFYRWQRRAKSAQDVEYPAYGITGPGPSPSGKSSLKSSPSSSVPPGGLGSWGAKSPKAASGDKKLAHSAHMFHFQHQKQQVIAMESHTGCERRGSNSGGESDEDNEEGDYTVYECPGLAPTGEMEVKNPLFLDDPTPATPAKKRQSE